MSSKKYFGTDGIRGQVGKTLINAEFMMKLGWAFGQVIRDQNKPKVLIGCDTRISGPMLESAIQAGLSSAGVDVIIMGVLPTPGIAHLTHSLRAQAGIVISASHNPYHDNGIKLFDANGMKLTDEMEHAIEAKIEEPMVTVSPSELGTIKLINDAPGRYIEFCKSTFPSELSLSDLKIVVDCANGATYKVAPRILHELGADVIAINNQPDGFNINYECGATDVRALQQRVVAEKADLGIALDGDGDRLIMVDHLGERVDGDEILCVMSQDLSKSTKQGIVGTVMTNLGLEQALSKQGVAFERAAVGDRYVLDELQKRQWALGGESSGHIVNLNLTTTGDGMISALQILKTIKNTGKNLNQLKQAMVKRPQVLINVPAFGEKDINKYPKIVKAVKAIEKQLNTQGRVLLRPSGTEPLIRVMVEGNDEKQIREAAESLAATVSSEMTE